MCPARQKIEETLWTSLRTFEERKNLLNIMAATSPKKGKSRIAQRARETHIPIERIKAMIQASQQKSGRRTLAHVDELMAQPAMAASAQANRDSHFAIGHGSPLSLRRVGAFVNSSFSMADRAYPCVPDRAYSQTRRTRVILDTTRPPPQRPSSASFSLAEIVTDLRLEFA